MNGQIRHNKMNRNQTIARLFFIIPEIIMKMNRLNWNGMGLANSTQQIRVTDNTKLLQ